MHILFLVWWGKKRPKKCASVASAFYTLPYIYYILLGLGRARERVRYTRSNPLVRGEKKYTIPITFQKRDPTKR